VDGAVEGAVTGAGLLLVAAEGDELAVLGADDEPGDDEQLATAARTVSATAT
jgi:hypothetical protein